MEKMAFILPFISSFGKKDKITIFPIPGKSPPMYHFGYKKRPKATEIFRTDINSL